MNPQHCTRDKIKLAKILPSPCTYRLIYLEMRNRTFRFDRHCG